MLFKSGYNLVFTGVSTIGVYFYIRNDERLLAEKESSAFLQ